MFQWMSKKLNQKRKGFTLIELVVVVAILGILAAIAIPRLGSQTTKAKASADAASVRTVESAVSIALADGHIYFNEDGDTLYKADGTAYAQDVNILPDLASKYLENATIESQLVEGEFLTVKLDSTTPFQINVEFE